MSVIVPKRRIYDGDVVNPEDFNDTLDDLYRGLKDLNEHNLDGSGTDSFPADVEISDTADDVAWRLKHDYGGSSANVTDIVNQVLGGTPEDATGALVFTDIEDWKTVWEFTWTNTETATYYAIGNLEVCAIGDADSGGSPLSPSVSGLAQFPYKDAMNMKVAWILDGVNPSEHVRGSLDTSAVGLNMERGFGGKYNAQDVSAVFPSIAPGSHTIRLAVLRAEMPDEVQAQVKRVKVPLWSAIVWEIRR